MWLPVWWRYFCPSWFPVWSPEDRWRDQWMVLTERFCPRACPWGQQRAWWDTRWNTIPSHWLSRRSQTSTSVHPHLSSVPGTNLTILGLFNRYISTTSMGTLIQGSKHWIKQGHYKPKTHWVKVPSFAAILFPIFEVEKIFISTMKDKQYTYNAVQQS